MCTCAAVLSSRTCPFSVGVLESDSVHQLDQVDAHCRLWFRKVIVHTRPVVIVFPGGELRSGRVRTRAMKKGIRFRSQKSIHFGAKKASVSGAKKASVFEAVLSACGCALAAVYAVIYCYKCLSAGMPWRAQRARSELFCSAAEILVCADELKS